MNKSLRVKFAGGREVVGILKGYDALMNLVLDDCVEYLRHSEDCYALTGESRKLGTVVCKTSAITTVNPVEGMTEIENPYETE
ncbi:U6 snRNA-associated Sm-like protein [Blastocystis sp. ATCC 50177/Nand II]|uniref:U6 snRNA-associated Sm-like protein n=1 Tax=Blastocystis sp. subtype 1 (strain ATCC 50177 / NandII) TaxID=478820 RepID=A0A196SJB6_BLAHN|nr:U6 snRNA-associated Sm-like protein [Blastocystis sp. ATCC 50177/Nand II]